MSQQGGEIGDLFVVRGDEESERAIELVGHLDVQVIEVPADDYLSPRKVPQLMTRTGLYRGIASIALIVERELSGEVIRQQAG
jgi:hypothetical protein